MAEALEHPTRCKAGEFVVLPEADQADETVWFPLEPTREGEESWEGLLCKEIAPNRVRIAAIPAFTYAPGI
jgi:hypothetical protein